MSISEAGGISDEMTVEFTPGPVHPPAMTTYEYRVIVTAPTRRLLAHSLDDKAVAHLMQSALPSRGYDFFSAEATLVASNYERRFVAERTADRLARFWQVVDRHADGKLIASFDVERHARHYADALEKNPTLVDDA